MLTSAVLWCFLPQGLAADDAHHIAHQLWSFAIPPVVRLCLPEHLEPDDLQTAIEIALRQLSILPEGSVIKLVGLEDDWEITAGPAAAAIAAAAPDLPHLTVVPPELPGEDERSEQHCMQRPALRHEVDTRTYVCVCAYVCVCVCVSRR